MKNLMVYISDTHNPSKLVTQLAKAQIDNSVKNGWKPQDIMFVTNFPFEYGKVKATIVNVPYFAEDPSSIKILAINKLFDQKLIQRGQLYWYHDLNVYQVDTLNESKVGYWFTGIAMTNVNTSSMFFRLTAEDIFKKIEDTMNKNKISDSQALTQIMASDIKTKNKIKNLDYSMNLGKENFLVNYKTASKPIRIVRFNPSSYGFFKKANPAGVALVSSELVSSLKYHKIV